MRKFEAEVFFRQHVAARLAQPKSPMPDRKINRKRKSRRPDDAGSIFERHGKLYVRVRYTDKAGKIRWRERQVASRTHAEQVITQIKLELEKELTTSPAQLEAESLTFAAASEIYKQKKLVEPVFAGDRKIDGMSDWQRQRAIMDALTARFGRRLLRSLTWEDLSDYKSARLQERTQRRTPTGVLLPDRLQRPVTITTVNRELQRLRAFLIWCRRRGWIEVNPFDQGEPLISLADEQERTRIATDDEIARILARCQTRGRARLKAAILTALDTSMRWSEISRAKWADVDFDQNIIRLRSTTTKTLRARIVPLTPRLREILLEMREASEQDNELIFGGLKWIGRTWLTVCREAGVAGLRFHDLRHTAITEMVRAGVPEPMAMRVSGHTQKKTFLRYTNVDLEIAQEVAAAIEAARQKKSKVE